ncbi:MAG: glycine--tRNA ligase subunit beta [Deltaproteobacteria bacterium]|nr:glycine--tRNA ligase subunit beta [Deltaproteobacteria bacterium]NIS76459.1 glycine--tRNA ligase subunit beta [Deltaproteobacteria bacterium]
MSRELFIEVGCEEIPAGFIGPALEAGEKYLEEELRKKRITFSRIQITGSPRRLVFRIKDVGDTQETQEDLVLGPPESVAFDASGKPTKAALGFAASSHLKVEDLKIFETEKGRYLGYQKKEESSTAEELFPDILMGLLPALPFKKSMRWADLDIRFARPVHWIIALYGNKVIDVSFGNTRSSNFTFGHRFLKPDKITINEPSEYVEKLKEAFVIVDFDTRKEIIRKQLKDIESKIGFTWVADESLLETVANLVEYPVTVVGKFEESYLELPKEILVTTMKEHQKYFVFEDESGNLFPGFATVSNIITEDMDVVVRGNEKVLKARLSDADFYYKDDLKEPLIGKKDKLKEVIYQSDLGTYFDKVERVEQLSRKIAEKVDPAKADLAARAAALSKIDLITGVVYEFPELQGIMGRDYALKTGEEKEVAEAVFEHYLPRAARDILPGTGTGAIVSIADKVDTICGCFGVGLVPTGTQDPYALRRQAIGVVNVIIDKGYDLSLSELITWAIKNLEDRIKGEEGAIIADVLEFFRGRLPGVISSGDVDHEIIDAVLNVGFDNVLDARGKVEALSTFKRSESYESLITGFKRAQNITRGAQVADAVSPELFDHDEERDLYRAILEARESVESLVAKKSYGDALEKLASLRKPIDLFFEKVLVMDKDEKRRNNRLALLSELTGLFSWIADFSQSRK